MSNANAEHKSIRIKKLRYTVNSFEKNQLNKEQRECQRMIEDKALSIVTGKAGSGKTLIACFSALRRLADKQIDQIVITRPTVSTEDNGFLPGDINEKLDPWMSPIYGCIRTIVGPDIFEQLMAANLIEIVPLTYMRGRTFVNSSIIIDEAQNLTHEQTLMVISRIGIHSNMVICGDVKQIDLKRHNESGLGFLSSLTNEAEIGLYMLRENHRHPLVDRILDIYESRNVREAPPKILTLNDKQRKVI